MTESIDWDMVTPEPQIDAEFLEPEIESGAETIAEEYDTVDPTMAGTKRRSLKSRTYEKKMRGVMNTAFRLTVEQPATVADAAAIVMHGPALSRALGDAAESSPAIARGIDMISDGSENPYAAVFAAALPFALQIVRNHEPQLEVAQRGIKVPFSKKGRRIKFKFGIKLGKLRAMTNDPDALANYVFTDPKMQKAVQTQGIKVGWRRRRDSA